MIKSNVGFSSLWEKYAWYKLDHNFRNNTDMSLVGDAANIPLSDDSC